MAFVGRTDVKDPGAEQQQWERLAQRRERLYDTDEQFRVTRPDPEVAEAARRPGLRIAEVMATVMEGYADRPALGERAREVVTDPETGESTLRLLPRFDTVTYRELWARVRAVASDWHHHDRHPLSAGDFVCVLGFASIDYTAIEMACIHLGAVVVPLQTSAPASQHAPILAETEPAILAVGIDYLETAVEAAIAGVAPRRLIVFDYESRDDAQRASYDAAARAAGAGRPPTDDRNDRRRRRSAARRCLLRRCMSRPTAKTRSRGCSTHRAAPARPRARCSPRALCIGTWLAQSDQPVDHAELHADEPPHRLRLRHPARLPTAASAYFAPSSDLSTLFEDLAHGPADGARWCRGSARCSTTHYLSELDRPDRLRAPIPTRPTQRLRTDIRENILGGRVLAVGCGSAALSPEIKTSWSRCSISTC